MTTIKITPDEARDIIWGDSENFKTIEENTVNTSRWSVVKEGVFQEIKTDKFYSVGWYSVGWSEGATESRAELPFEHELEVEFVEVHQVEKTMKVFVKK